MQENYEIFNDLIQTMVYFTSYTVCSGDIKKGKSSENEKKKALKRTSQLVIFRAFFSPPHPKSEKKSRNSTNKKNLA